MEWTSMSIEFFGREDEIKWLRAQFEACAARDVDGKFVGPRMAFIIAESGLGKTRLVQELYLQLSNDDTWDPPQFNYWPDAFRADGDQMRTVPNMDGHVAKGPPRFAWLGARWTATDVRNPVERERILPKLKSSIMVHAAILNQYGSIWSDAAARAVHTLKLESLGEVSGEALGRVIALAVTEVPFAGLIWKLGTVGVKLGMERVRGPKSVEAMEDQEQKTEVEEVIDCMQHLLGGKGALPTVLWLDDAQWIDELTLEFVDKLWRSATSQKWPLLIVFTHWEQEWNLLAHAKTTQPKQAPLDSYKDDARIEHLGLKNATKDALAQCVTDRLPGLTARQRALMVEKANGNFLTMIENIGELVRTRSHFVEHDVTGPLAPVGERKVNEWEFHREKRVKQRFESLDEPIRHLLGWSSQQGVKFLRDVVSDAAVAISANRDAAVLIERCVDPYVVLCRPTEHMREFRDKIFHIVASRHFEDYSSQHRAVLEATLRRHLTEWVNNSFDAEGDEIWPNEETGIAPPERSATALEDEERRDLLGMALRELPIPSEPNWELPEHVAAVRAVYLLVITDWREILWDQVRACCRRFDNIDWSTVPQSVISISNRDWLSDQAATAGAFDTCESLRRDGLRIARALAQELNTPQSRRDVSWSLNKVADIEEERGDLDSALAKYEESLGIRRALVQELNTPEIRRDVIVSLHRIAGIEQERGDLDSALAKYEESLGIARALAQELNTPESRRDVSVSLGQVAGIEEARGDLDSALAKYEESLGIDRALAQEINTPESRRDVIVSLHRIADIEKERGDLDSALAKYEESLGIARDLFQASCETIDLNGVVWSLHLCAGCLHALSRSQAAAALLAADEPLARTLEAVAEGEADILDTCAVFWESFALVCAATAQLAASSTHARHAAGLRKQIADTKATNDQ
ncbi:MAG: ATP-binding protein [Planctomycetes bacterium]|nr:ATP-binding protein [Planctomycetota bacterium]